MRDQSILRDNIQQNIVKHSILSDDSQKKITSIKATDSFDKGCMSFTNNIKGDTTNISVQKSRTKRRLTPEQAKDKIESRKEYKRISRQNSKLKNCNIEIKVVPQRRYRKPEEAKSIQVKSETGENYTVIDLTRVSDTCQDDCTSDCLVHNKLESGTVHKQNFKDQSTLTDNIQQNIAEQSVLSDEDKKKMTSVKTTNSFDKGCMSFAKNVKTDTSNMSVKKSRTKRKLTPEQVKDKIESRKEYIRITKQNNKLKKCNTEIKVGPQQRYKKFGKAKSIQVKSDTAKTYTIIDSARGSDTYMYQDVLGPEPKNAKLIKLMGISNHQNQTNL